MKKVDEFWFTSGDHSIGIIVGEDAVTLERKAYMGVGQGFSQVVDARHILELGVEIPVGMLKRIIKDLETAPSSR